MHEAGRRSGGLGRRSGERGFSLAELVVTFSMAGILVAIGALSLGSLSAAFSLDAGSRTVAMAFSQARVFAIARARTVTVTFGGTNFVVRDTQLDRELLHGAVPDPVTIETTPLVGTVTGAVASAGPHALPRPVPPSAGTG